MARSGREHGRVTTPVLAARRPADPGAVHPRRDDPALRQLVRRPGDGLPADRRDAQPRADRHRRPDPRRRAPQPGSRLRHGDGNGRDHGDLDRALHGAPAARRAVAAVMSGSGAGNRSRRGFGNPIAWLIFLAGVLYFLVPLLGTFFHSIRTRPDIFLAYRQVLGDPKFFGGLAYSFTVGVVTIIVSLAIIVPTAYWVRLRVPRLRPVVEFVTLMPFVIPPVVLVFGLIRVYGSRPLLVLSTDAGSDLVLVCAYVVLSFPYMYRAVDTGLAAIDVRSLTEAAQSLGSGWTRILWRVIFPNLRTSLLSGAFLTLAIVICQ